MTESPQPQDRPLDPEKLLRIASMVREVLNEAKECDPDKTPNEELASLHSRVTGQIKQAVPEELAKELEALDLTGSFQDGATSQEVRLAYSGLIGWLQGLFQGLQAAMQMQALQGQMPGGLPKGATGEDKEKDEEETHGGRYL